MYVARIAAVFALLLTLGVGNAWGYAYLKGSWDSWTNHDISGGSCEITLAADTEYEFGIDVDGSYYSYTNQNFTNTSTSFQIYTSNGNCKITTGEAGTYIFKTWYDNGRYMAVYFPQARLVKQKYIYFDVRNQTNWNSSDFDARFWFKYYDSGGDNGSADCEKGDALENWVYYALVPDHDYIGQIQMNRLNPSNHNDIWCTADKAYAKDRTSSAQNCLKEETGKADYCNSWTPQWTTYCPPMSSVTLADNGTTTWGGNGGSSTPYLVPTGGDIKVHVTASASALDDANMTKYFLFKKAGSAVGSGSSSTEKTITASGTTGTKEAVIVEAYNYYNSTEGTHLASSAIYYEARTPYTISYNAGTNGSGSRDSETKLKGVNFTLPSSAVFERTGYTQTGWTTSDGGTQTHALGGSYTSDAAQEFFPVWTAKTYTINLANMEADDAGTESVEVTYDASTNMTSTITKPTKAHYDFGGYYTSEDVGETLDYQLIDEDGNWVKDVTGYTSNDGAGNPTWVHDYAISLYAKWTETAYTITMAVSPAGTGTTSPASTATGKLVTESGDITATPAAGYKFKEWQFSKTDEAYDVWCADGFSSTDATIHIKAQHNGTLTAVFEERYSLVGSLQDDSGNGGMPGWKDYSKTFTVNSSSPVDLTRTCTLQAGKTYKVQVHDLATSTNLGRSGCDPVCVLEENASLVMENSNNDVFLYTSGAGEYIFKITAVDGSGHPTLTVLRPYPVNFGQKYEDIDGTLHSGTTGGTAAASASGALTSGDYVTYNTSVTHTATPEDGYTFAGWWSSDEFEGDAFSNTNPMTYAVTSGDNTYAKFVETSTTVTLANDGKGHVEIDDTEEDETTCGVTTTRSLTAVPNDGYMFDNWTTSSSPDFDVDDADAAEVTLTGHGTGTAGTLTANFTYRWALKAESAGWGESQFIIGNIGDVSGDVVGYVEIDLAANTNYEFTMKDLLTNDIYKNGTDKVYYMTYTNHTDWGFTTGKTYNCGITTAGKGTYRFTWNITDKTMTVTYPLSYQVNYGVFPSVGGSVTVIDDDSQSVPSGGYVRNGGSVTYTAAANTGFTFEGWYTDDTYKTQFSTESSWTDGTVTKTSNSYAKFDASALTFTGGAGGTGIYWNDASNWSPACVPTIYHDVTVLKYCEVGKSGSPVVATAKNIVIDTVGHAGARLLVNAGYALAVEEMIKVKTSNTPTYGPTTENLLKLESDASYKHGALAVKGYNDEQMDIVARVEFHTQSCVHNFASLGGEYGGFYVNQFIGTPLRNPDLWDYYGCWIYKWDPTHHDEINDKYGDWVYQSSSTPLEPFRGYDILSEIEYPETYWLEGQLVYAQDTTLDLYYNAKHVTDMGAELGQENMFANSWTAPIDVSQMTTSDFAGGDEDKMEATIYVFNSGWPNAWEELKDKIGTLPGQYLSMSVKSAEYTSSITCIPAMQAFSVFAKTAGASLTLDYDRIVYNPLLERSTAIEPMRAPRRARTELSNDDPEIMRIRVEGAQGADQIHLLLREDFNAGFDNGWDARKMFGESYAPQIFAITEDGNMSVNCIPDAEGTVLGFRKGSDDSEYTFRFEYDGEETLYLNDLMTQTSTLIDAESTYTFNAAENDAEARFVISANPFNEPAVTTGWSEVGDGSKVHKLLINGVLYIIRGGRIYNASGMMVR